ncbi:hypothetical protein BcabD6B2_58970 (apicoplast) [Babesia caballi]|uniref:Uncharacterized protein n=1 Tax=Babesia caballi TaxID=5871 RepID=A0AAV4M2N0_BABCB|nr:hypothetical protein BcabD6B2_58970 [Babesia caballi]
MMKENYRLRYLLELIIYLIYLQLRAVFSFIVFIVMFICKNIKLKGEKRPDNYIQVLNFLNSNKKIIIEHILLCFTAPCTIPWYLIHIYSLVHGYFKTFNELCFSFLVLFAKIITVF